MGFGLPELAHNPNCIHKSTAQLKHSQNLQDNLTDSVGPLLELINRDCLQAQVGPQHCLPLVYVRNPILLATNPGTPGLLAYCASNGDSEPLH